MSWKIVFNKFLKGFIVAVVVTLLTGAVTALTAFVPEGTTQVWLWKLLGPALIGAIIAGINAIKHWNDATTTEVKK